MLVIAACFGFAIGSCANDELEIRAEESCELYCLHAKDCGDDGDVDACIDACTKVVDHCLPEQREPAIDRIDACADESCEAMSDCTIDAGLQCHLAIPSD